MLTTHIKVITGNHNPKVDHNITLAGLLVTDANTVIKKLDREKEGLLKGLYAFKKKIPTGEVYICNGTEFPNADAVDLLLYLIIKLEDNNWEGELTFKSVRQILRDVFNVGTSKFWIEKLIRLLVIWKNHSFYFPKSFTWEGKTVKAYFGVIDDFIIESQGKGKPAKVEISFNRKFIEICKNTDWYRRPPWSEIRKLRKETAKRLYMLALEYKPGEKSKEWKIYLENDLKHWYRNAMNSLANPKYLRPSIIFKRLTNAIEEINGKTNLKMNLQETKEGNYCIVVKEVIMPGVEKVKIPFDNLPEEDKAVLIAYTKAVAEKRKIRNILGFLRSMNTKQVKLLVNTAKKHFNSEIQEDEEVEQPIEQPEQPLKGKLSKVLRSHGINDFLYNDSNDSFDIFPAGANADKIRELKANRELMDTLSNIVGKPVKIV